MNHKEQQLLKYLVESLATRLGETVARFGGDKAKQDLERLFGELVKTTRFEAAGTGFHINVAEGDWYDGEPLLKGLAEHTTAIVGKNTVKKEISEIMSSTETKLGISLYEVFFRLGIHKYQ